jgi:Tfp pilus assembly protein PilE
MSKIIKKNKKKNGYALLELLFYISFFAVLTIVVINAMIIMARSFKETTIQAEFVQSGAIMERISREIRQASSASVVSATDLKLDTNKIEFNLSGADIQLLENGTLTGTLNAPNITVTALAFTSITTAKSKAVRIVLTLKADDDASGRLVNFYDTVVLRGSY